MEKIFCVNPSAFASTDEALRRVLADYCGVTNAKIVRGENGKPFLENERLFVSVSHTAGKLFIALSDENVGIDAESTARKPDYLPIVKKFTAEERKEISSSYEFLRYWTVKESAVKWLGGSLSRDLNKLRFVDGKLFYGEIQLPAFVAFPLFEGFIIAVCGERDFSDVSIIITEYS